MADTLASARGLTKRFTAGGPPALDSIDIAIEAGRMTGLVGPDGAGKTTLIRMLNGLIEADEGEINVLGRPVMEADRTAIGYMPQRFGLYEDLSVLENLTLYADLRSIDRAERTPTIDRLLEFTDLKRFSQRPAGRLSGGMKQKLGLACALIRTPRLLLLDEPGVGVDPVSRRELWAMVRELTASGGAGGGVGVLWSTAYLDEAEMCDTVYLLSEGRLLHGGPPDDLTAKVEGRVLRMFGAGEHRRATLEKLLNRDDVADGTIQGASIRLLMRDDKATMTAAALDAPQGATVEHVAPRFEDAFIDLLGGGPRGTSPLATGYRPVPESRAPAIEADKLTRRFGDFIAADGISFTVERGEIFGLLGPNGAGKSTTFKMLCGLLTPTSGECRVAGHDLRRARADARQSLGYMAQKFSLYGDLSVRQNLDFFAGAYGLDKGERAEAIDRVVDIFHLERYIGDNSASLPLGYKQRLALACAVMHQPPVLFLDEPTSGVDPIVRREFWVHINGLVERGVTVLVTTHFMDEAEYCDRLALIYRAKEIAIGTPDQLKRWTAEHAGLTDPTMEDAFIALIKSSDTELEAA